jgi:hypothetical protein
MMAGLQLIHDGNLLAYLIGPCYIALGQTALKTPIPAATLLLCAYLLPQYVFIEPLPSSGQFLLAPLFWPFTCHGTVFMLKPMPVELIMSGICKVTLGFSTAQYSV